MIDLRQRSCLAMTLVLLMTGACGDPDEEARVATGTTAGIDWAILPVERGDDFWIESKGYWRPDAATVRAALVRIEAFIRAEGTRERPGDAYATTWWRETTTSILAKLTAYRCQVMGVETEQGRRVYLNFVHDDNFEPHPDDEPGRRASWTTEPVCVDDGGDWYWQVWLDPETGAFTNLSVNGEA